MMRFLLLLLLMFSTPVMAAYDKPYIGETVVYRAAYEDTFVHLARDYNLGFVEMRAANPAVDPWLPGEGTKLLLPMRHLLPNASREGVVINLPEMRLYAYVNGDAAPTTFPIGIGREGLNTPEGSTKIVRKKAGPTWRPTARMIKEDPTLKPVYPPGPDNPLGTHALYLGWPTYAIHGTNKPFGIGRRISSGCIRLYPENIEALFNMIPVGTKVQVVDQPIKLAWIDDRLYMEAHPELEHAIQMEEYGQIKAPKLSNDQLMMIKNIAGEYEKKLRWPAIRMAVKERKGYPIEIARRPHTGVRSSEASEKSNVVLPKSELAKSLESEASKDFDSIVNDLAKVDEGVQETVSEQPVADAQPIHLNP